MLIEVSSRNGSAIEDYQRGGGEGGTEGLAIQNLVFSLGLFFRRSESKSEEKNNGTKRDSNSTKRFVCFKTNHQ